MNAAWANGRRESAERESHAETRLLDDKVHAIIAAPAQRARAHRQCRIPCKATVPGRATKGQPPPVIGHTADVANRPNEAWPEQDARLLTMLSTSGQALTLGEFLLRCEIDSVASAETVRGSMGRLVGGGLARWSDGRFFVTSEGRAVAPGGTGRYFKDLFKETAEALSGRAMEAEADLGLTADDFDAAVAYVVDYKDRRRTRRGYSGYEKWAEWHDAPPLTFGECLEFLTFSEGRQVDVGVESAIGTSDFAGALGLPLPPSASDPGVVVFAAQKDASGSRPEHVELDPRTFETAAYRSYDGVDYFTLEIKFTDGTVVTVGDSNH